MRDAYEEELRLQALRLVILDEAQHLIQTSDGKQPKDQLDWIKSITIDRRLAYFDRYLRFAPLVQSRWAKDKSHELCWV